MKCAIIGLMDQPIFFQTLNGFGDARRCVQDNRRVAVDDDEGRKKGVAEERDADVG